MTAPLEVRAPFQIAREPQLPALVRKLSDFRDLSSAGPQGDDVPPRDQITGSIHAPAVDLHVAVGHQLARREDCGRETQADYRVAQPPLQHGQERVARESPRPDRPSEVAAQLGL